MAPKAHWLTAPPAKLLRNEAPALLVVLALLPALSGQRAMDGAKRGGGGDPCRCWRWAAGRDSDGVIPVAAATMADAVVTRLTLLSIGSSSRALPSSRNGCSRS